MSFTDTWGEPLQASEESSVAAWNDAWVDALHFQGSSFELLAQANADDQQFVLGSVFCAAYRILGGTPLDAAPLVKELDQARLRAADPREIGHLEALSHMAEGNFTKAAEAWEEVAIDSHDLAAYRFAHDIYLHVGDDERRLRASSMATDTWRQGEPGWAFVTSQHAFALEETGQYDAAEETAWSALDSDPLDLWALHALAHVYESTNSQDAALDLFRSRIETWSAQQSLCIHIWWHFALRLMVAGEFEEVLSIHDRIKDSVSTAFQLSDLSSMLWRLDLLGVDVGDRWDELADRYGQRPERHTSAFLDLHSSLTFARRPKHPEAKSFFGSVAGSHRNDDSENGATFREVVTPLVEAIRLSSIDPKAAAKQFDAIAEQTYRIGGSIAQRQIITLTHESLETT